MRERTLLQALMERRNLTRDQTVGALERRARTMDVASFSLTTRQLDRLLAGDLKGRPRSSTSAVLEEEFGFPISLLLAPADHVVLAGDGGVIHHRRALGRPELVAWLADAASAGFEAVYDRVADAVGRLVDAPPARRAHEAHERGKLPRRAIAEAVQAYYDAPQAFYSAAVAGPSGTDEVLSLSLSVMVEPSWTGLDVPLGGAHERTRVVADHHAPPVAIGPVVFAAAAERLARVEAGISVLTDNPLHRLRDATVDREDLDLVFGLTRFVAYALTVDLMEDELMSSLVAAPRTERRSLPIRDRYLPTIEAATAFDERICAGGPACLLAIAREEDYLLVVQERSATVLNSTGRLAVVPKAFHQPLSETSESAVSATLRRELEEELLGRDELDQISPDARQRVAPGHRSAWSAPMRWLDDHNDAFVLVATGFGINMVSGNYEVACLAIVDDPTWWDLHAEALRGNWEMRRTIACSSKDTGGLLALLADPRWSDEGLFAFLEGLRRLRAHRRDALELAIEVQP